MDKYIQLQKALSEFHDVPERIKMHPKVWYEIMKDYMAATTERFHEEMILGIPVVVDRTVPEDEFVIE